MPQPVTLIVKYARIEDNYRIHQHKLRTRRTNYGSHTPVSHSELRAAGIALLRMPGAD